MTNLRALRPARLCKCGCGNLVIKGKRYVIGHAPGAPALFSKIDFDAIQNAYGKAAEYLEGCAKDRNKMSEQDWRAFREVARRIRAGIKCRANTKR